MQLLISVGRYIVLLIFAAMLTAYGLGYIFSPIYGILLPSVGSGLGDLGAAALALYIVALQFYVPLFFISLGDEVRHWAFTVIFLIFALLDYQLDSSRVHLLLFVVILGGSLGWLLRLLTTNTIGKMPALEPYKKYF